MVDGGQIGLLARVLSCGGKRLYAPLYPGVALLGGMAFGQGLPGDFLLSQMQVRIAPMLGIPLMLLVGIVTVVTMGPPNALKPTQISYAVFCLKKKSVRNGDLNAARYRVRCLQPGLRAVRS